MITFASMLWRKDDTIHRYKFEHVLNLYEMIGNNYDHNFDFICFVDDFDARFKQLAHFGIREQAFKMAQIPEEYMQLAWTYPKLYLWSNAIKAFSNEHMVYIDIDCVITGNITSLIEGAKSKSNLWLWKEPKVNEYNYYNTSMILRNMRETDFQNICDSFLNDIPTNNVYRPGNDQGYITEKLGKETYPTWSKLDGVLSHRRHARTHLPKNSKIVFFHGTPKPWEVIDGLGSGRYSWIKDYYPRRGTR